MGTENNVKFSAETRKGMYESIGDIITTYFSETSSEKLSIYNLDMSSFEYFFQTILLNSMIAKATKLIDIIERINIQVNRDVEVEKIYVTNGIRGKLDVRSYLRDKYYNVQVRKEYPCFVLKENYEIPENVFVILIIKFAFEAIKGIPIDDSNFNVQYKKSGHFKKVAEIKKKLYAILHSGDFRPIIEQVNDMRFVDIERFIQQNLRKIVEEKVNRRILSRFTYGELLKWWDEFRLLYNGDRINFDDLDLLLYNEYFDDKLFELWLMAGIKKSFETKFNFIVDEENPLWNRTESYIYKFSDQKQNTYKVYIQKSSGLMWGENDSEKVKWRSYNIDTGEPDGFLQGNLDIIVTCNDSEKYDPVIIDAKNITYSIKTGEKIRVNPVVSDKVYKMIGYFDNFNKKALSNKNGLGMLIFTNKGDKCIFEKTYLSDQKDATIDIFSINPSSQDSLETISKYILNSFGCVSTRMQTCNTMKSVFLDSLQNDPGEEKRVNTIYSHVISVVKLLLKGKEQDLSLMEASLKLNRFGETIWTAFSDETRKYLAQSEYLFASIEKSINLEYSAMAITLTKGVEQELDNKLVVLFKKYLDSQNIRNHQYFVINNVCNGEHLTMGNIGHLLNPRNGRHELIFENFILNEFLNWDRSKLSNKLSIIKALGKVLTDFAPNRNLVAHKDGIDYEKFMEMRDKILGIGAYKSILIDIYGAFRNI